MNRLHVTTTKNDVEIYVDLIGSPAASKVAFQPRLLTLAREALANAPIKGKVFKLEKDMGRVTGRTDVVKIDDEDAVFYAKRLRGTAFTPFIKNHELKQTQYLALELRLSEDGSYQLWDIRAGRHLPALPGEDDANAKSKPFWSSHAVIWDNKLTQTRTITKICPWLEAEVEA